VFDIVNLLGDDLVDDVPSIATPRPGLGFHAYFSLIILYFGHFHYVFIYFTGQLVTAGGMAAFAAKHHLSEEEEMAIPPTTIVRMRRRLSVLMIFIQIINDCSSALKNQNRKKEQKGPSQNASFSLE
jgi:hypothetical protein